MLAVHCRRLRELWRSAGWPCHDAIELELLGAGMLSRHWDGQGRETLRVTDAGLQLLAATRRRNQAAFEAHEALVARVALEMQRAGRVVWRQLSLRAPLPAEEPTGRPRWAIAMPDVYSIRHTTVEDYTEPVVHEIKVSRADLLSDLRRVSKGVAYLALSSQCWYVLRNGIAEVEEVPLAFGVMFADEGNPEVMAPGTAARTAAAFCGVDGAGPRPRRGGVGRRSAAARPAQRVALRPTTRAASAQSQIQSPEPPPR